MRVAQVGDGLTFTVKVEVVIPVVSVPLGLFHYYYNVPAFGTLLTYFPLNGFRTGTPPESNVRSHVSAGTFTKLKVHVTTCLPAAGMTVKLRKNLADALTVTVPSGGSGDYEVSGSISALETDHFNIRVEADNFEGGAARAIDFTIVLYLEPS